MKGWQPHPFKAVLDAHHINSALSFRDFAQFDFTDKSVDWALRLSRHYYNTEEEIDLVTTTITALATQSS